MHLPNVLPDSTPGTDEVCRTILHAIFLFVSYNLSVNFTGLPPLVYILVHKGVQNVLTSAHVSSSQPYTTSCSELLYGIDRPSILVQHGLELLAVILVDLSEFDTCTYTHHFIHTLSMTLSSDSFHRAAEPDSKRYLPLSLNPWFSVRWQIAAMLFDRTPYSLDLVTVIL